MIDWLTLHLDTKFLDDSTRAQLEAISDKIMRITPQGDITWCTSTFHSLRSDTAGLSYSYTGSRLTIAGSPASIMSQNNVFGSDDINYCFRVMVNFFVANAKVLIPFNPIFYTCTRVDITYNLYLGTQENVTIAIDTLKNVSTRGDNVERKHSTIYWNKSSKLRSGKAYNKYLHAKRMSKTCVHHYSDEQMQLVKSLLRFELKLGREWFQRLDKNWYEITPEDLKAQHDNFFENIIGTVEVTNMAELIDSLIKVSPTEGRARAAFKTYQLIQSIGYKSTIESMPRSTWYKHKKLLLEAGLCLADLQTGQIVPFRRTEVIEMKPVHSWAELKLAVGA